MYLGWFGLSSFPLMVMGKPRKESLSDNVFVAVKAEREVSKAAMVWALAHVVRPGDSIH